MQSLTIYLLNFLFTNLFFLYISNSYGPSLETSYNYLSDLLLKISAPFSIVNSSFLFSIPISLGLSFIVVYFIKPNFSEDNIEKTLKKILLISITNIGIFSTAIFFLKMYEFLSRFILISYFIIYPILFAFSYLLLSYQFNKNLRKIIFIILFIPNIFFYTNSLLVTSENVITNQFNNSEIEEELSLLNLTSIDSDGDYICNDWLGSDNYRGCVKGLKLEVEKYDFQISNIIVNKNKVYILLKPGLVYVKNSFTDTPELYLDISKKVSLGLTEFSEQGIYSIAFHPTDNYLMISYSNNDVALVVEKYYIDKNEKVIDEESEEVFVLANNTKHHFGGSLIWSDFFDSFMLGIGDMKPNNIPVVHSGSLNTTDYKGKVILLGEDKEIKVPLISETNIYDPLKNIVAYGLRNPWQIVEFDNSLYIADVGAQFVEELNKVDYQKEENDFISHSFGWPLFTGEKLSYEYGERGFDELNKDNGDVTDLYYWENDVRIKADKYLLENSEEPIVFYDHYVNADTYRAAIIGGDVIGREQSKYFQHLFFTEYTEREIFAYDIVNDSLFLFPFPESNLGSPTALRVSPFEDDTLLIATTFGELISVNLP